MTAISLFISGFSGAYITQCTVSIEPIFGFDQTVQLSITPAVPSETALLQSVASFGGSMGTPGLPPGASVIFAPASIAGGSGAATLQISGPTPPSPLSPLYWFNIVASSGLLSHQVAVSMFIIPTGLNLGG